MPTPVLTPWLPIPGIFYLLGYLVFALGCIALIERWLTKAFPLPPQVPPIGAPFREHTIRGRRLCETCGVTLEPHEGSIDYGDGKGPQWECDGCLGVTN